MPKWVDVEKIEKKLLEEHPNGYYNEELGEAVRDAPGEDVIPLSTGWEGVPSTPAGQPLTLKQLRGMDGRCVKVVVDWVEPLEMLALVEVPEDEDCVLLRNNLGGASEFYSDEDLRGDGVKVYAYPPAHIDREAWGSCGKCKNGEITIHIPKFRAIAVCNQHMNHEAFDLTLRFRFCPYCGRPLTEEAWEEFEKRMGGSHERDFV